MISRPSVPEERQVLLAGRAHSWWREGFIDETARTRIREMSRTRWMPSSLFSRLVFFVLTLVSVAALFTLLELVEAPFPGAWTAILSIGIAEFLILRRRFLHMGPEEALYLGGLFALVFDVDEQVLLLLALASVVAGFRVLNDLFFVLGASLLGFYLAAEISGTAGAIYCVVVALIALALLTRPTARPLWARTLASLILVLPPVAFLMMRYQPSRAGRVSLVTLALFAVLAIGLMAAGLRWRFHSAIFSGLLVLAEICADLTDRIEWRGEIKLLFWGIVTLTIAFAIERALRVVRHGITAQRLVEPEAFDLIEIGGVTALGISRSEAPEPREGGEFGGGGASGRY